MPSEIRQTQDNTIEVPLPKVVKVIETGSSMVGGRDWGGDWGISIEWGQSFRLGR
jgi:hypothetical protein